MCPRCHAPLGPEDLACPACHALRYGADLERLKQKAHELEAGRHYGASRAAWLEALTLLPPNTRQAAWIVQHIKSIEPLPDADESGNAETPWWIARLGVAGPIVLLLIKGKGVFALFNPKTLLTLGGFMAYYAQAFGAAFGIGFAVQILIHEMGHYADIRRRGLPADMPVFFPGIGAYVRWRALGVSDRVRAEVSLAGPLAGAAAAIGCALVWWKTADPVWAALARAGAWLNVLNLVTVWALDGGQAAGVLGRSDRFVLMSLSVMLWLLLGESVFLLVAGGAAWRLYTKDLPAESSSGVLTYFAILLVVLGVTMWLMPGHGAGFGIQPSPSN